MRNTTPPPPAADTLPTRPWKCSGVGRCLVSRASPSYVKIERGSMNEPTSACPRGMYMASSNVTFLTTKYASSSAIALRFSRAYPRDKLRNVLVSELEMAAAVKIILVCPLTVTKCHQPEPLPIKQSSGLGNLPA